MNSEVRMPMPSVTAKPLTGPEPSQNSSDAGDQRRDVAVEDGAEGAA